nr:hypothetical protein [Tanacetum cinerariifolium]
ASPSPDYVPGPEHPPLPVYVPEFVPELVYPKFMPAEDDILPVKEEPLPADASPTTESLGYIDESNPDEDPKDDPEEDPADYSANGGDEGDDEDESSDDGEDDDIDIEGDEEEDEYLAPTDSIAVTSPAVDHAPSAEEIKPFETDESAATPPPHPGYRDNDQKLKILKERMIIYKFLNDKVRPTLKESITWSKDMIHYFKEKWEVDRLKEIDTQEIEDVLEVNNGTTNIMMDNEISGIEGEVLNEDFYGL